MTNFGIFKMSKFSIQAQSLPPIFINQSARGKMLIMFSKNLLVGALASQPNINDLFISFLILFTTHGRPVSSQSTNNYSNVANMIC